MKETGYIPGEWRAVCDLCGFDFLASELFEDYLGRRVCKSDLETRHPQEFVRPKIEKIKVPWSRPAESAAVTEYTTDQSLTASLTPPGIFYFDTDGGAVTATVPDANAAGFNGVGVRWTIKNIGSGGNALYVKIQLAQWGGTDVPVPTLATDLVTTYLRFNIPDGVTVRIRNNPSTNLWYAESVIFGAL